MKFYSPSPNCLKTKEYESGNPKKSRFEQKYTYVIYEEKEDEDMV